MAERYRTHYDGEFVIVSNKIQGGKKYQEREWIDNPIQNQHISGRAAVIGHGDSRYTTKLHGKFNLCNNIEKHKGGHLARKRLQSYGAEKVWEEMICDFYVEFDVPTLEKLIETKNHMALVVDEYGSVSGLVTMEDVIETLLGLEIMDESDNVSDLQHFARKS